MKNNLKKDVCFLFNPNSYKSLGPLTKDD